MISEVSWLFSQKLVTGTYLESAESISLILYYTDIHFNNILPLMLRPTTQYLPLRLFDQQCICVFYPQLN